MASARACPPGHFDWLRILLVSERALICTGIEACLRGAVMIVGRAKGISEASRLAESARPHVAVVDLAARPLARLHLVQDLHARGIRIVTVSSCADLEIVTAMLNAGVQAYLLDGDGHPPLLEAIRDVAESATPRVDKRLESAFGSFLAERIGRPRRLGLSDLAEADLQLLVLLSEGCSNGEIGRHIGLSVRGVEARVDRIFTILNVRNRTEAAAKAAWLGLYRGLDG